LVTDDLRELVHDLVVDADLEVSFAESHECVQWFDDNLRLSSKENGHRFAFSVNVLDSNGHWVFSSAVLGEEVGATWSDFLTESVCGVIEG
jgi:hypothetical protein